MKSLPKSISATFEKLQKEYLPYRIVLKKISNHYYVYKERGVWRKDIARTKIISEYLGKITEGGVYVKKALSAKDDLENAKALIELHGGEIIWHEKEEPSLDDTQNTTPDATETDLRLLTCLSMNARMSPSKMASLSKIKKEAVYFRIKTLEKGFGIKYIMELDVTKLGYMPYLILVKFEEDLPYFGKIKDAFYQEPLIQFAAKVNGNFDLVLYVLDTDADNVIDNIRNLIYKLELGSYDAKWNIIPIAKTYSFMPVRDEFIEKVVKTKEWKKTTSKSTPKQDELKHREFIILKELNSNSREDFSEIERKYELIKGSARYAYAKLKESGIIIRPTITMTKIQIKYLGMIIVTDINEDKIRKTRYKFLSDIIEYGPIINKYALFGNIGMPIGTVLFLPVIFEGDLENNAIRIRNELEGSIVKSMVITEILVGSLSYRRFDNEYSRQHRLLVELGKREPKILEKYE